MIDLLREECGASSAENCATIKKKGDLAVNVSGRLPGGWLPAPMKIGAFDQPEADPRISTPTWTVTGSRTTTWSAANLPTMKWPDLIGGR
jgi:hypothetical protein